jgi:ABC-type branched-subunit amino acid transport system ATPase component
MQRFVKDVAAKPAGLPDYAACVYLPEGRHPIIPIFQHSIIPVVSATNLSSKEFGLAMLIVEQKVLEVLEICHRVYSIKLGRVAFEGKPQELKGNKQMIKELFL